MQNITIRRGSENDIDSIFDLIIELAEYEHGRHFVTNTKEKMIEDGFGENPLFYVYVAEFENKIVGFALYYIRYSTWKGKRLYLEDILVTEKQRKNGIGQLLFDALIEEAKKINCSGLNWQVLDWNLPAISFYEKNKATIDSQWLNGAIELMS
jgi:GNAT superfamily N-acetyltransferase